MDDTPLCNLMLVQTLLEQDVVVWLVWKHVRIGIVRLMFRKVGAPDFKKREREEKKEKIRVHLVRLNLVSVAPSFPSHISITIFFAYPSPFSSSCALLLFCAGVTYVVSRWHSPVLDSLGLRHGAVACRVCGSIAFVLESSAAATSNASS